MLPSFGVTDKLHWQELNATHAADLRLLQEAKERERVVWEREIDAALSHVKVIACQGCSTDQTIAISICDFLSLCNSF
jgi:hypothetical protein